MSAPATSRTQAPRTGPAGEPTVDSLYVAAAHDFARYEVVKDLVDELIDLMLNYRQSGHPGGSRSKVHAFVATLLSGAMRWDLLRPWRRFGDRFVLSAGHTVPLAYATLAVLNEAMRARFEATRDPAFAFPDGGKYALTWEDLLGFRCRGGLPGHAEMSGKTLFLKWNTGPSGHGMPCAAGQALALRMARADGVKVFVMEGEGGLTPGAAHETRNSAWGLGLSNLVFLVDWNDYGIDDVAVSSIVPGTPADWFRATGWRVAGTLEGSDWVGVTRAVLEAARGENPDEVPSMAWFRTRKGRGYLKYDNKSHGSPHPRNGAEFWTLRRQFMERYGVAYEGVGEPAPLDPAALEAQAARNYQVALSVLRRDPALVTWLSDRLAALAATVPDELPGVLVKGRGRLPAKDPHLFDFASYPSAVWAAPGSEKPNRAGLEAWASWVNSYATRNYGRPLVIACSADLAESTNIAGFAKGMDGIPGAGWYDRKRNRQGALLPQAITEFTNAGLCVGLASVNFADDPFREFDGYWSACSTYGAFSYLKYGPMRLFSQLYQDRALELGKVIWVAGHSGPETAEDSRTHFGIFETGVTQLFPEGAVIDLHPWEPNEVPVVLGAALAQAAPIVALHLTRPKVRVPDRAARGMPSHFAAARGAYVLRDFRPGRPRAGTVLVQGTMPTAHLVEILPELDRRDLNVKVVAAISPQLFALQDAAYRSAVVAPGERWDSMLVTNRAKRVSTDWLLGPLATEYSLTADWDDRWRTGGSVDEVMEEAHLSPARILAGIERFVAERGKRLGALREALGASERAGG